MVAATRRKLEAALSSARATVSLLEAEIEELDARVDECAKLYGLDSMAERRGLSANTLRTWARSGRLPTRIGARKQYLVTDRDVDAALAVAQPKPAARKSAGVDDSFDALAAELSSGRLVRLGRGR